MRLQFQAGLVGDMSQCRRTEIFKKLPNVFVIADEILIVDYDADNKAYDRTLRQIMKIYHKENLILNSNECMSGV